MADRAALRTAELHERYGASVLRYCSVRLRSAADAEDAAQSVFVSVYRSLAAGVEPQSEGAWIFKIAERAVLQRARAMRRRARVEYPSDLAELSEVVEDPRNEAIFDASELASALSRLPDLQRRALLLHEWNGLSYADVGRELGVGDSTVTRLIRRARRAVVTEVEPPRVWRPRKVAGIAAGVAGFARRLLPTATVPHVAAGVASLAIVAAGTTPMLVRHHRSHTASAVAAPAAATPRTPRLAPVELTAARRPTARVRAVAPRHVTRPAAAPVASTVAAPASVAAAPAPEGQPASAASEPAPAAADDFAAAADVPAVADDSAPVVLDASAAETDIAAPEAQLLVSIDPVVPDGVAAALAPPDESPQAPAADPVVESAPPLLDAETAVVDPVDEAASLPPTVAVDAPVGADDVAAPDRGRSDAAHADHAVPPGQAAATDVPATQGHAGDPQAGQHDPVTPDPAPHDPPLHDPPPTAHQPGDLPAAADRGRAQGRGSHPNG